MKQKFICAVALALVMMLASAPVWAATCPTTPTYQMAPTLQTTTTCPTNTLKNPTKPTKVNQNNTSTKPVSGTSLSDMASEVVRQTNSDRAKNGLGALTVSAELTRAACVRANEIVSSFSHTRPDGNSWTTVSTAARGENIAKGQQNASKVMAAWMSSSGHRANILRASFGSIGVCAYKVGNIMYWVQLFGK